MSAFDSEKTLQNNVLFEYGKKPFSEFEIPSHISQNLSKELREYQKEALKYYLANAETIKAKHLMFNMATGSGKTLIMASLMLDLFKQGYTKFVFFVNSTAILEKTKANFCDKGSSKYLFSDKILINDNEVDINAIQNFDECKDTAINIYFSTIQGLFSLFKNERENSLTLQDLQNHKIVFIADEAHHLNSETKQKLKGVEADIKDGWESVIKKAFVSNSQNLMLEFTATIPKEKAVLEKYKDKIIFEFDLAKFCKDGFSKRIFLVKYDDMSLKARFLGAMILSVFREEIARNYGINLKPVVLFKSETIATSKENQALFLEILENLSSDDIGEFYANLSVNNTIFSKSFEFFKGKFGARFSEVLAKFMQNAFKKRFLLNVNDEKESNAHQILLNSLENDDNEIRAIFAVDKLNEGWDVLNLFDIVRLGTKKSSPKTTTAEVQLIGRGARYFPFNDKTLFDDESRKFMRKFDNDSDHLMVNLEILTYHSFNDVAFITDLEKGMAEQGLLFGDNRENFELNLTKKARQITAKNRIFYVRNKRTKGKKYQKSEINRELEILQCPYFSKGLSEKEVKFNKISEKKELRVNKKLSEAVEFGVFAKALNILNITFADIKDFYECKGKFDFYTKLSEIWILFDKRQKFTPQNQLEIAKFILTNFKKLKEKNKNEYEVSEFMAYELKNFGKKFIFRNKDNMVKNHNYEWLYYDKFSCDSDLEIEFLKFIQDNKDRIDKKFKEWFVLRNDGFDEFKIYDNREFIGNGKNQNYGAGFEPDFIFFGKKADDDYFSVECFFEPKGRIYKDKDGWKEELLKVLDGMEFDKILDEKNEFVCNAMLKTIGFPFFFGRKIPQNQKFDDKFNEIFK